MPGAYRCVSNADICGQGSLPPSRSRHGNTIRGIRENRILTEGFAWANTELRIKLVNFKLFNQFFYIAINPFFDAGIVTKTYRADAFNLPANNFDPKLAKLNSTSGMSDVTRIYDATKAGDIVYSTGAGLKLAMNQNFIISVELAKCLYKPLDAGLWIGIGINYQF